MKKQIPVNYNHNYDVSIIDLTYQGLGVAKIDGYPIFVENTLPGEKVRIQPTNIRKKFGFGQVNKFYVTSKERVHVLDEQYTQTGIAPLQHLNYSGQLKFKQNQVKEVFDKLKIPVKVLPTIGMEKPNHYRNKAQIPVREINGQLETGFYHKNSHKLIPIEDFYIQDPAIDQAIVVVRNVLRKYEISAYNENNYQGIIRNVMVRRGQSSHEIMIGLITNTKKLPNSKDIINDILKQLPEVKSIIQNVNTSHSNAIFGNKDINLYGKNYIKDQLLGLDFIISLKSFYQVNPTQTEKLYSLAVKKANLTANDTIVDAYCGIGTISLYVAKYVKRVYGVEIVPEAIQDAKDNAKLNHIDNAEFIVGKAEEQMQKWDNDGLNPNVVIVDPPRKGLAASLIESTAQMHPERIVYVSCNPSTLARDAKRLANYGYYINQPIQPVDQFPQTVHVESITIFEKSN